jgi:hypothetical protein
MNDASSSKSTNVEPSLQQQLPFGASSLLVQIQKQSFADPELLIGIVTHLSAEFPNFTENYEQLIKHTS